MTAPITRVVYCVECNEPVDAAEVYICNTCEEPVCQNCYEEHSTVCAMKEGDYL